MMIAQNNALTAVSGTAVPQTAPAGDDKLALAGQLANQAAKQGLFARHYQTGGRHGAPLSESAVIRYERAVSLLVDMLADVGITRSAAAMLNDESQWAGITYGLLVGYRDTLVGRGYSARAVNLYLNCVRKLAQLAQLAGVIPSSENLSVKGLPAGEQTKKAGAAEYQRRLGRDTAVFPAAQKTASNHLTPAQIEQLLGSLPGNEQGWRDEVVIKLLAYCGLRVGELVALRLEDYDQVQGTLYVYRQKTRTETTQSLNGPVKSALDWYLKVRPDCDHDRLLVGSLKNGCLTTRPLTKRAVQARVQRMGQEILGLDNLSPHDLRHSLATRLGAGNVSEAAAMDFMGWSSSKMFHHYRDKSKVASIPDVWK